MERMPCVYIMTNGKRGTLYVGVTSALAARVYQHRTGCVDGFTRRYGLKRLVWFEAHMTMLEAIAREKAIKRWKRAWKIALVESFNPAWRDLYPDLA